MQPDEIPGNLVIHYICQRDDAIFPCSALEVAALLPQCNSVKVVFICKSLARTEGIFHDLN
jgi:hypothetical protein